MELRIPGSALKRSLFGIAALVSLLGLAAELARARWPLETFELPIGLVSLSHEQNLPTWFSSHLIILCAAMLALVSFSERGHGAEFRRHWRGLAFVFAYLSLDEAIELHEGLNLIYESTGVLHFFWVVPFGILVLLLGFVYLKFVLQLPLRTRLQFIFAGSIYVSGALGIEMFLGYWTELHGDENLTYSMIDWVEESMEIGGMSLFAWSLGSFLLSRESGLHCVRSDSGPTSQETTGEQAQNIAVAT